MIGKSVVLDEVVVVALVPSFLRIRETDDVLRTLGGQDVRGYRVDFLADDFGNRRIDRQLMSTPGPGIDPVDLEMTDDLAVPLDHSPLRNRGSGIL